MQAEQLEQTATPAVTDSAHVSLAERAYYLWESRGCPDGMAEEIWLEAERILHNNGAETVPAAANGEEKTPIQPSTPEPPQKRAARQPAGR